MSIRDLIRVKNRYSDEILKKRNVVGVGVGKKTVQSEKSDRYCIRVYVSKKLPVEKLSENDLVQPTYDGYETDVIETGKIKPF